MCEVPVDSEIQNSVCDASNSEPSRRPGLIQWTKYDTPKEASTSSSLLEKEVDSLHESFHAAAIEAPSRKTIGDHIPVLRFGLQRIGELHFAVLAGRSIPPYLEYVRCQDIAPDDGKIGRRILRGGLLHHALDADMSLVQLRAADNAVPVHVMMGHLLHGNDAATIFFIHAHHLRHHAGKFADTQIVGQNHAKGLIADQ